MYSGELLGGQKGSEAEACTSESEGSEHGSVPVKTLYTTKARRKSISNGNSPKVMTLASLPKTSRAYKEASKRISFSASGVHFEPLQVMENRKVIQKLRKLKGKRKRTTRRALHTSHAAA